MTVAISTNVNALSARVHISLFYARAVLSESQVNREIRFPYTHNDSLIVVGFRFRKVKVVIASA